MQISLTISEAKEIIRQKYALEDGAEINIGGLGYQTVNDNPASLSCKRVATANKIWLIKLTRETVAAVNTGRLPVENTLVKAKLYVENYIDKACYH